MQHAEPYRFVWDEAELSAFFLAYERERITAGVGATLQHVSIRQRADAIMTMTGLNVGACWRRVGEESAKALWRRYLTPVLAETRESAAALDRAIEDNPLPGYFEPAVGTEAELGRGPTVPPVEKSKPRPRPRVGLADIWKALLHVVVRRETGAAIGVLAGAVLSLWLWASFGGKDEPAPSNCPPACVTADPHAAAPAQVATDPSRPVDEARSARLRFLDITIAAAEQYRFSISPYTLAEYYAGEADFVGEPALFLQAMLKRWPLPAYEPIPPTLAGAYALGQYSLAAAELDLATGLDRDRLKLGIDVATQETPDDAEGAQARLYARIEAFRYGETEELVRRTIADRFKVDVSRVTGSSLLADSGMDDGDVLQLVGVLQDAIGVRIPDTLARPILNSRAKVTVADVARVVAAALDQPVLQGGMQPVPRRWPDWPRWLLFLPLLPVLGWALVSGWRAWNAALTNPPESLRGTPTPIASRELANTAPKPERRLARQISWHPPVPSGRLDVRRSIAQTVQRGGFAQPVFGTRSRSAEFLFLVPRHRDNDHERERIARLIAALEAGGATLNVYEYSPDPRTLVGASARSTQSGPLDLRALQELHGDAQLVLVTDGNDLIDYFSMRPYPFVAENLRAWPARMLLTPIPMAEWGEREMNLSAALAAPIGRATSEGFQDLAAGFGTRRIARWRPPSPVSGGGIRELVERIQDWLKATAALLGATHSVPPRPEMVRDNDYLMLSDIAPPDGLRAELVEALRKWLGADGFYWLAACAGYPQLRYAITVYLGTRLYGSRGPIYEEEDMAKLCMLPWFRQGRMPLWLRESLFAALPPDKRSAVGRTLAAMLSSARAAESVSSKATAAEKSHREARDRRGLTIWLPDENGAEIAPDEVVADFMLRDMPEVLPTLHLSVSSAIFRRRALRIVLVRVAAIAAIGLWCWAMLRFWPSSANAPHAPGVWLPLIAVAVVTAFGLLAVAVYRRLKSLGWFAGRSSAALGLEQRGENSDTSAMPSRDPSEVLG
ncbi:acyl carrier protein [Mesorhizobium sp. GbtcB19]|uniref:acyl carrier protein n=1 Tax=Mesorhizobium sp. GbtcB19 TaxID=2824764 RepID=UPI001C2FC671|nr:acyl carrier protein [Mesorhizobium sp. GbtcB19]